MTPMDLVDFRGKITPETAAVLEAMKRASGRDQSEIAREVLHEWALSKIREATLIERLTRSEGREAEAGGKAGNISRL